MYVETLIRGSDKKWSMPFPALDSEQTLVTVFGPSSCLDEPGPVQELLASYPRSTVIGCSTAGEIFDTTIHDGTLSVAVCRFERTRLRAATAAVGAQGDSRKAGRQLAESLAGPGLRSILVISDGI